MNEYQQLWNKVLRKLEEDLGEPSFGEVFQNCPAVCGYENNYIYVTVPNALIKFRIEQFYGRKIKDIVSSLVTERIGFKFVTVQEYKKKEKPVSEPDRLFPGYYLSSLCRFENFIVGESNRYAYLTALKVAESRNVLVCNPLYIFGDVGLGKTHLMTSIGNYILDNDINAKVVYTGCQKFAEDYFLATSDKSGRGKIEEFYRKYNDADVLLVDDIQFLEGKRATQEEFFKIFEHLVSLNKQIVLTSDRPANNLKNIMSRLQSRFNWGISVDIKLPDKDLLISILENKLSFMLEDPSRVEREALETLASFFPENIRDLEGALRTFVNYCICMNRPFNRENLFSALEKIIPGNREKKNAAEAVIGETSQTVCSYFSVSEKDLRSSSRKQRFSYARQMLMYILRNDFGLPLRIIGDFLGRDHATIAHGVDKIKEALDKDVMTRNDYGFLLKAIEKQKGFPLINTANNNK